MLVKSYTLGVKGYLHHSSIVKPWNILGASWGWLDKEEIKSVSVSARDTTNDYEVVSILHTVLSEADILAGHNSDKFDLRKFNTRALFYGFQPIAPKPSIDTLKVVRKHLDLPSYSLAYINKYFGIEEKTESPDWDLVMAGDEDELRKMRWYNRGDVISTKALINKVRGFLRIDLNKITPIRDVLGEIVHLCPSCQSPQLRQDKPVYRKNGSLAGHLYQCIDCGRWNQK